MNLNEIAFNNLNELVSLDNKKYFVIDNKEIKLKCKSELCEDIDNVYKNNDVEYPIYFTFTQLIILINNSSYYINKDFTKKTLIKKLNIALDNLFLYFLNDIKHIDNIDEIDDINVYSLLHTLDDFLCEEYIKYEKYSKYYNMLDYIDSINKLFFKMQGFNFRNHDFPIKYFNSPLLLPDLFLEDTVEEEEEDMVEEEDMIEEEDNIEEEKIPGFLKYISNTYLKYKI